MCAADGSPQHRDIKPENFLLADTTPDACLKATDFGLSMFFKEGQKFREIVGSAYYVAPEVLKRSYSKEADIWSLGVMLYILLCGVPPFYGDTEAAIFQEVLTGTGEPALPWCHDSHGPHGFYGSQCGSHTPFPCTSPSRPTWFPLMCNVPGGML